MNLLTRFLMAAGGYTFFMPFFDAVVLFICPSGYATRDSVIAEFGFARDVLGCTAVYLILSWLVARWRKR